MKTKLIFLAKDAATQAVLKEQPHILHVDEDAKPVAPADGKYFRAADFQEKLVCAGGELITLGRTGLVMIVDEESKLKEKPYNHLATSFWLTIEPQMRGWDYVAGSAIICRRTMIKTLS